MYICSLSSSLELPGRWTRVRRSPLHWHMSDPRRIILSDQHPWTFTCSTISYGAPPWFLLLGRIVNKMWDLSPMQRPKFLLPHTFAKLLWIKEEMVLQGNQRKFIHQKFQKAHAFIPNFLKLLCLQYSIHTFSFKRNLLKELKSLCLQASITRDRRPSLVKPNYFLLPRMIIIHC